MCEKIKISWDEVHSAQVDQQLRQQDTMTRATQHYEEQTAPGVASSVAGLVRSRLWYNSFFYTAVFGFIGGLSAWLIGEVVMVALRSEREEFYEMIERRAEIVDAVNEGEISEASAERLLNGLYDDYGENPYVQLLMDESVSQAEKDAAMDRRMLHDGLREFIQNLVWFGLLGIMISCSLSISDHVVGGNWRAVIINGSVGIVLGLIGGVLVGTFINQLYNALGGGSGEDSGWALQIFARAVGWAVLGLFIAIAPGIVLRNWKRSIIGLIGGFMGGLLGGLLFDPVSLLLGNAVISRGVAIVAIGVIAGLGTGVIENVAKSGWVKVIGGLLTGKQFILYKNATAIGSSPQCEIYLFKDLAVSPQHAAVQQLPIGYELLDLGSSSGTFVNGKPVTRARLRHDDRIQIGSTVFVFQERKRG